MFPSHDLTVKDGVIKYGLVDIKGVGQASYDKIKREVTEIPETFEEFMIRYSSSKKIGSGTMEALIESGALPYKKNRKEMLHQYHNFQEFTEKELFWLQEHYGKFNSLIEAFKGLARLKSQGGGAANKNRIDKINSIAHFIANPASVKKDTPEWIIEKEESRLGMPLTYHPLDVKVFTTDIECIDLVRGKKKGQGLKIACKIESVKKTKTKKTKKDMCFLTISDPTCMTDNIAVFSKTYEKYKNLLRPGEIVQMSGECKDDSYSVEKVWKI